MIILSNIASFSFQSVNVSRSANPDFSPSALAAASAKSVGSGVGVAFGLLGLGGFLSFPGLGGLDNASASSSASLKAYSFNLKALSSPSSSKGPIGRAKLAMTVE